MITCVSSNISTQKSLGNHANQDERGQPKAATGNSSNDIQDTSSIKYDNKTESNPPNENLLPGINKAYFTQHVSDNISSLSSNTTNKNEGSLFRSQTDQKIPNAPQFPSNKFTPQSLNSSNIPGNSIFPGIPSFSQNFTKPIRNTSQSSEHDLSATNRHSDEEEDNSEPVLDSESDIGTLRSNSFRDIKSMVPRGYGKMGKASLTKTDSEASIDLSNNSENTELSSNSSQKTSDVLEEMRRRHAAAWKSLGYDPTHGKGDMRGSATLANFSPLKLIRQSNLFAQNGFSRSNTINNNQNSIPKQVMQSYSLCIKPAYRTMKRVNSSNGPLSNLVDENCADEDENQALNSPFNKNHDQHSNKKKEEEDDNFIPPIIMTTESLLNGPDFFKDDDSEEYLIVEEEEEEEEEEFEEEDENDTGEISNQNSNDNKQIIDKSGDNSNNGIIETNNTENFTDLTEQTKK